MSSHSHRHSPNTSNHSHLPRTDDDIHTQDDEIIEFQQLFPHESIFMEETPENRGEVTENEDNPIIINPALLSELSTTNRQSFHDDVNIDHHSQQHIALCTDHDVLSATASSRCSKTQHAPLSTPHVRTILCPPREVTDIHHEYMHNAFYNTESDNDVNIDELEEENDEQSNLPNDNVHDSHHDNNSNQSWNTTRVLSTFGHHSSNSSSSPVHLESRTEHNKGNDIEHTLFDLNNRLNSQNSNQLSLTSHHITSNIPIKSNQNEYNLFETHPHKHRKSQPSIPITTKRAAELAPIRALLRPSALLGEWRSTSIAANDCIASILYIAGPLVITAGVYSMIPLLITIIIIDLYRFIYTESISALKSNGGLYSILLNTTSKQTAALISVCTLLSYISTAVVSAVESVHYFRYVVPFDSDLIIIGVIGILAFFAILSIIGMQESSKVALTLFIIHVFTLTLISLFAGYHILVTLWYNNGVLPVLLQNFQYKPVIDYKIVTIPQRIFLGLSSTFLGYSGFETSSSFVREQKKGVFPQTLRNMWLFSSIFNVAMILSILLLVDIQYVVDSGESSTIIAHLSYVVGGKLLQQITAIDSALVLAASVLTAFTGCVGVTTRLVVDRNLPQFLLQQNTWRSTYHWIILSFFILCTSMFIILDGNVLPLNQCYSLSFLSVMLFFGVGLLLLKFKRASLLQRVSDKSQSISIPMVLVASLGVILAAISVIVRDPTVIETFLLYYFISAGAVAIMLYRAYVSTFLVKMIKHALLSGGKDTPNRKSVKYYMKQIHKYKPFISPLMTRIAGHNTQNSGIHEASTLLAYKPQQRLKPSKISFNDNLHDSTTSTESSLPLISTTKTPFLMNTASSSAFTKNGNDHPISTQYSSVISPISANTVSQSISYGAFSSDSDSDESSTETEENDDQDSSIFAQSCSDEEDDAQIVTITTLSPAISTPNADNTVNSNQLSYLVPPKRVNSIKPSSSSTSFVQYNQNIQQQYPLTWYQSILLSLYQKCYIIDQDINHITIGFFSRHGDLKSLNKAIQYITKNEDCRNLFIIHCFSNNDISTIPSTFYRNVLIMQQQYDKLNIEPLLVNSEFTPAVVAYLSLKTRIPRNLFFITTPTADFKYVLEDFGGVRVILQ